MTGSFRTNNILKIIQNNQSNAFFSLDIPLLKSVKPCLQTVGKKTPPKNLVVPPHDTICFSWPLKVLVWLIRIHFCGLFPRREEKKKRKGQHGNHVSLNAVKQAWGMFCILATDWLHSFMTVVKSTSIMHRLNKCLSLLFLDLLMTLLPYTVH